MIRETLAVFLRFTHRYWFHEVSEQPQARELFRMTQESLGNDRLYNELREEIGDMDSYLDSDALRQRWETERWEERRLAERARLRFRVRGPRP